MEALTVFGALNVAEGAGAMAVLAPAQLPPGNISWTAREIHSADQAFAAVPSDPSFLNTWLLTSAAFIAWKEATFMPAAREEKEREKNDETPPDRS